MLKIEFQKRDSDLVKLEQAEERMATELKTLNNKIEKMQDEIKNKFSNSEKH
jgi:peptidoglycan hydrolase CwlO-like protein